MPKKKVVIASKNKEQRRKVRSQLGALSDIVVSPATRKRYDEAVKRFFSWASENQIVLPTSVVDFDQLVASYIDFLWEDGEGRSLASNTVAGLQFFQPTLKRQLVCSWRLLGAWAKHEMPARAPPLTPDLVEALAGCALKLKLPHVSLAILIGFYGLLRTAEICNLSRGDMAISLDPPTVVLNLGLTKGGARSGALESVTLNQQFLVKLCQAWVLNKQAGDKLLPKGPGDFRKVFADLLRTLQLQEWGFKPYSLRRGGATDHFRRFNSLSATVVRGRWSSAKMARICLNDGLATLASFVFTEQKQLISTARKFFRDTATLAF
jgi:hypothetical protein